MADTTNFTNPRQQVQTQIAVLDQAVFLTGIVTLDGIVNTSLAAAYAALPNTGGIIYVVPGYTETLTADINMTKPMVSIVFLGPATITMGTHVITTALNTYPSISGLSIRGPSRGSNDAQVAGQPTFIYTGSGKAISVGQASGSDVYGIELVNFGIDITGAGTAAKGLYLQGVHEVNVTGINVQGKTATGTTQIGIDSDGNGASAFSSYQTFRDIFVFGTHTGVLIEGPSNNGNNSNTFIGGSIQPASDGTGLFISTGDTNQVVNMDLHNAAIGLRFGGNSLKNNMANVRIEGNSVDVQFDSGSSFNSVYTSQVPVVTDNSGVTSNWAIVSNARPTSMVAYNTTTAASGNIQVNLQPNGNQAPAGTYRMSVYFEVTTVATGGTYGIQALYTDEAKAETLQLVNTGTVLTSLGATQATAVIRTNGSANVTYKVTVSGITGTPSYTAYATLERLF